MTRVKAATQASPHRTHYGRTRNEPLCRIHAPKYHEHALTEDPARVTCHKCLLSLEIRQRRGEMQ